MKQPKVALVHDWLYGGGAELVVEELHKLYPEAPIYTSYCSDEWRNRLNNKVVTGYLQNWPFSSLRKFLPVLRQRWFAKLNLSEFDLVISSSGNGEARFVRVDAPAAHISYCHTPTHFYWRKYDEYLQHPGFRPKWLIRLGLKLLVRPLRKRDYQAAQKVDHFVANSTHIQNDIKEFYNRDSTVIHPPVDTKRFSPQPPAASLQSRKGFIVWGRHVPYKRFDLAIAACNQLHLPLTIVGSGPETERLKNMAGPTVRLAGRVSDEELVELAKHAQAFLFPGEEDFGISPVEAMSAGLPIIAYRSGGALDYVDETSGLFFKKQSVASLVKALRQFQSDDYDSEKIIKSAQKFSTQKFQTKFKAYLKKSIQ